MAVAVAVDVDVVVAVGFIGFVAAIRTHQVNSGLPYAKHLKLNCFII